MQPAGTSNVSSLPPRRVRVAQVVTGLVLGGGGQVMSTIARNIDRSRFDLDFYCVIEGGAYLREIEDLGFKVTVLPAYDYRRLVPYNPIAIARLARCLQRGRYDVVHTHLFQADVIGRAAARLAGIRTVVKTMHNMGRWKTRNHVAVDRALNRWTRKTICVSDYQRREVMRQERLTPAQVEMIPNGVDVRRFNISVDRAEYLHGLGLRPDRPVIGTVGRLIEEKGHIHLLKAIPQILRTHPSAQFLIVGDGRLRESLTSYLEAQPYRDAVKFAGLRPDIPELLSLMDVFVFPSLSEGFPIALIEAMAARRAVACSRIPQVEGVIIEGQTGLYFDPSDSAGLATTVSYLLLDPTLRDRLAANAVHHVEATYSEVRMLRTMEGLYLQLLAAEIARR
jgi:glycosyltransferase involved in cell wall biosynthesis